MSENHMIPDGLLSPFKSLSLMLRVQASAQGDLEITSVDGCSLSTPGRDWHRPWRRRGLLVSYTNTRSLPFPRVSWLCRNGDGSMVCGMLERIYTNAISVDNGKIHFKSNNYRSRAMATTAPPVQLWPVVDRFQYEKRDSHVQVTATGSLFPDGHQAYLRCPRDRGRATMPSPMSLSREGRRCGVAAAVRLRRQHLMADDADSQQ